MIMVLLVVDYGSERSQPLSVKTSEHMSAYLLNLGLLLEYIMYNIIYIIYINPVYTNDDNWRIFSANQIIPHPT